MDVHVRRKDHPMPEMAAFVQQLRDAFGDATIDDAVRRGKAAEPWFYACENSRAVATASPSAVTWQVDGSIRDRHIAQDATAVASDKTSAGPTDRTYVEKL